MNFVAAFIYVTTEEKNAILVSITSRKMGNSRSPSCINLTLPGLLKTRAPTNSLVLNRRSIKFGM